MAQFFYKALKNNKELVQGYIEAADPREARTKVRDLGFLPTNIYEESIEQEKRLAVGGAEKRASSIKLNLNDKILFTSELQTLLASGISIFEALESVAMYSPKKNVAVIASDINNAVKNGATFSEAIGKYSDIFGNIYITLCYAGETSGTLPAVLNYLLVLLKKQDSLKSKFIQMSIYPALLVLITCVVYFFMGGFVFPKLISGLNLDNLPMSVSFLVNSVSFVLNYWMYILVVTFASLYGINLAFGLANIKQSFSKFVMNIPILSDCVQYFSLAHYMSVMQIAYDSGIPIIKSMEMASSTIDNSVMNERAKFATRLVSGGESLTDAYYKSELIPKMLMPLISTGEKTGKLGQMFRDAAIGIEKKLDFSLNALAKAFEPTLMVVIGLVVGFFAIAFVQVYVESMSSLMNIF